MRLSLDLCVVDENEVVHDGDDVESLDVRVYLCATINTNKPCEELVFGPRPRKPAHVDLPHTACVQSPWVLNITTQTRTHDRSTQLPTLLSGSSHGREKSHPTEHWCTEAAALPGCSDNEAAPDPRT